MRLPIAWAWRAWVLMITVPPLAAQRPSPRKAADSPRAFVEGFYAWYLPRALHADTSGGWNATLKLMRPKVNLQLAKLLREDAAAQAKCEDLISLDFDPFLNTQDPAEHYLVGGIVQRGSAYRAEIYRMDSGKGSEKPDVIAEFTRKDGRWLFVNFIYPGGSDLLTLLKSREPCLTPRTTGSK